MDDDYLEELSELDFSEMSTYEIRTLRRLGVTQTQEVQQETLNQNYQLETELIRLRQLNSRLRMEVEQEKERGKHLTQELEKLKEPQGNLEVDQDSHRWDLEWD